ncbi:MAG: cupredoxin domain-containing protein [Burkholderiales bacterium]
MQMNLSVRTAVARSVLAFSGALWAHGGSEHKASARKPSATEETAFGKAGDPKKVIRTIQVEMHDTMRFLATGPGARRAGTRGASDEIRVNQGDTVKFIVSNDGKVMHEMVIGTMKELKEHAELMRKHPGMEHDEAYMAHVAPGKKGEVVWQFTKPGEFYYACLVGGHFEAGMVGKIVVSPGKRM